MINNSPENALLREVGYCVKPIALMDKTMHRAVRGHPLSIKENEEIEQSEGYDRGWNTPMLSLTAIPSGLCTGHDSVTRASLQNLFACFNTISHKSELFIDRYRRAVALEILYNTGLNEKNIEELIREN